MPGNFEVNLFVIAKQYYKGFVDLLVLGPKRSLDINISYENQVFTSTKNFTKKICTGKLKYINRIQNENFL